MTILVAPDKFKGTLSAVEVCDAVALGVGDTPVTKLPLADGGEGTLEALVVSAGGTYRTEKVRGPNGFQVAARFGLLGDDVAVVEMARASGLQLVAGKKDPLGATTYGTGELIRAAMRAGAREIIVGVGGSASTDGGAGAIEALGFSVRGARVVVACDVRTTFVDAARKFAKQKGATDAQIELLVGRLEALAVRYKDEFGVDVSELVGSGAAGGLAGGLAAIGAEIADGFSVVAEAVGLEHAMSGVDTVITGEGKLDATSFEGKVVSGVLEMAGELSVPNRMVICGQATPDGRALAENQGAVVFPLTDRVFQSGEAFTRAALLITEATRDALSAITLRD